MPVSSWDLVPGNNNAAPPNGWPEGMAPSDVNNVGRQMMADVRKFYDDSIAADGTLTTNLSTLSGTVTTLSSTVTSLSASVAASVIKAVKTANESSSSASFHSDAELTVTLAAGTYYEVDALIVVSSSFNGTMSFQMLESQTHQIDALWCHSFLDNGSNATLSGGQSPGSTTSATVSTNVTTLNKSLVHIKGFVLTNASNAPTYTLQWENGTASTATVLKGSYLKLTKLT